jgi:hypothetical protein
LERQALTAFYAAENPSGVLETHFRQEGMNSDRWIEDGEARLHRLVGLLNRWALSKEMNFRLLPWVIDDVMPLEEKLAKLDMMAAEQEAAAIRAGKARGGKR